MRKLDTTVIINKPAKAVWDYMDNPDNMPKWLDNFVRYEHVSGERGATGSKGRHYYNEKGREFAMDEEILDQKKHEYIKLGLTSKSMDMIVENYLKEVGKNKTEFRAVAEFTRVGLMMKLMMALFMSSKKAQQQHVDQINKLKELVEQT